MGASTGEVRAKRYGFCWIIAFYSVWSVALLTAAWYASGIAPNLMFSNYRSVQYASQMDTALISILLAELEGREPPEGEVAKFNGALKLANENVTEENEQEVLDKIQNEWTMFIKQPLSQPIVAYSAVSTAVQQLTLLNEAAMYRHEERSRELRLTVIAGGVIGLLLMFVYSVQLALAVDN